MLKIGVLSFQGGVIEHINATKAAAAKLGMKCDAKEVKYKKQLDGLDALIIPGGESTTLFKLCEREGIFEDIKKIKNIFGTCAGAIMISKLVKHGLPDQKTLGLMNIETDRNAYGPQTESFETDIKSELGNFHAVFIRAPKITTISQSVKNLATNNDDIVACEEKINGNYYLATSFHPELTTTKFHELFLTQCKR